MLFPWYTKYPYQNDEVLNLDWILKTIENLVNEVANFVTLNTIEYADPIQWNISTQYKKNTVVIDPISGSAYISTKPVPAGVGLNNTDYWNIIFTLDVISANKNITLRDDANNMFATFESNIDDWLLWQGTLYIVTRDISIGQAYVDNYNISRYTIERFLKEYISNLRTYVDNLAGDLSDLDTTDDTNLVAAINETIAAARLAIQSIGTLTDLTTTDKTNLVAAINETIAAARSAINSIGDIANLTTTDKSNTVSAINEVLSSLTTAVTNLSGTMVSNYNTCMTNIYKRPRNIVVVSDSYGDTNVSEGSFIDRAINILSTYEGVTIYNCAKGSTSFNNSVEAMNFLGALKENESQITDKNSITDVVVLGGHNDMGASQTDIATGMENFYNYVAANYPNAKLTVGFIGYTLQDSLTDEWYVAASVYYNLCTLKKMAYTNVFENVLRISSYMKTDLVHPNVNGQIALAKALVSWCLNQNTNVSYYIGSNNSAITPRTGISISGTPVIESRRFEKTCIIDLMGGLTFTYTGNFTSNSVDNIAIGTLSESVYRGDPTHLQWVPVPAVINNGSKYYTVYGEICFANNLMYFRAYGVDANLSVGFWNFTNPTILIGRCTLTFND